VGSKWTATLTHLEPSSYSSISDIRAAVSAIEGKDPKDEIEIDLVVISHHLQDHWHKDLLLSINASVPVLSHSKIIKELHSWVHFTTIEPLPVFDPTGKDWRSATSALLPSWLGIFRWQSQERFRTCISRL